jgi:hypothetical protein
VRYLTVILFAYRAQVKLITLQTAFNVQSLRYIIENHTDDQLISQLDRFAKNTELFDKIITNAYKFGVFIVGGPVVAALSIMAQHLVLPLTGYLWKMVSGTTLTSENTKQLEGFVIFFVMISAWIMVSAWMDMRGILIKRPLQIRARRASDSQNQASQRYSL